MVRPITIRHHVGIGYQRYCDGHILPEAETTLGFPLGDFLFGSWERCSHWLAGKLSRMSATCFEAPGRQIAANRARHAAHSRVEDARRGAYISAMTDLTPPEIFAWLETLPLREQLVALHAMTIAIPTLQRSHPLKARIAAAHVALDPTARSSVIF